MREYNIGEEVKVYAGYHDGSLYRIFQKSEKSAAGAAFETKIVGKYQDIDQGFIYCILLPDDAKTGFVVTEYFVEDYQIDPFYKGKVILFVNGLDYIIEGEVVIEIKKSAGMRCSNRMHQEFFEYAEPNMPDGKFLCYSCRTNPVVKTALGY